MVYEDTCQVLSDGTIKQYGYHRRIDTAAETEYYTVVAKLLFQLCNRCIDKRSSAPFLFAAADVNNKVFQELLSFDGATSTKSGKQKCIL